MKRFAFFVSISIALVVVPGPQAAQNDEIRSLFTQQIAKSGCCKVRKSPQHPWSKTGRSFSQCEKINQRDEDSVYKSKGKIWWDRSC